MFDFIILDILLSIFHFAGLMTISTVIPRYLKVLIQKYVPLTQTLTKRIHLVKTAQSPSKIFRLLN